MNFDEHSERVCDLVIGEGGRGQESQRQQQNTERVISSAFFHTIITLVPCALNAELQHFILRFNKNFLLCGYQ
jgi:hypothetical protein